MSGSQYPTSHPDSELLRHSEPTLLSHTQSSTPLPASSALILAHSLMERLQPRSLLGNHRLARVTPSKQFQQPPLERGADAGGGMNWAGQWEPGGWGVLVVEPRWGWVQMPGKQRRCILGSREHGLSSYILI